MRNLVSPSVSAIVHHQSTLFLLLFDDFCHLRIGIAASRSLNGIGIPHHSFDHDRGQFALNDVGHFISIRHVDVFIAVIPHEHHHVLPVAGILVLAIGDELIHHNLCIVSVAHRKPPHSHIQFVGSVGLASFAIIQQAEETVIHITVGCAKRVFALMAEQKIISVQTSTVAGVQAVIPHTVAKEQQV